MSKQFTIAVVGATGAVGSKMMEKLIERNFPIKEVKFLASSRSAGKDIEFNGITYKIEEAKPESFEGVDIALFSAGGSVSAALAPEAAKRGAIVIDNTSHFRMNPDVPLVVPEVNRDALKNVPRGIIANPNCSTIQMVAALQPIRQKFGLTKVIVSTYQAVSGSGIAAIDELREQSAKWDEGTLMGLSTIMTGISNFDKIKEWAAEGNRDGIDLLVKDIYQGMDTPIDANLTASNFGKVFK